MPPENIFFLALVVFAFAAFAVALAYGSAVAGGSAKKTHVPQASVKAKRG